MAVTSTGTAFILIRAPSFELVFDYMAILFAVLRGSLFVVTTPII